MKCRPSQSRLSICTALFSFLFASFLLTAALYETTEAGDTLTSQRVLLAAAKAPAKASKGFDWKKLGAQVYTNTCAACHQPNGQGVPNTFPPLKGNAVVLAKDPKDHIQSILKGVQGKKIGGVAYQTPMPPQANLSDEEIAAVVNHERTSWGNNAPTLTPEDVKKLRGK